MYDHLDNFSIEFSKKIDWLVVGVGVVGRNNWFNSLILKYNLCILDFNVS